MSKATIVLEHGSKPTTKMAGGGEAVAPYVVTSSCDHCGHSGWGVDSKFDVAYEEYDDVEVRCIACETLIEWLDDQGRTFEEYRAAICGGNNG